MRVRGLNESESLNSRQLSSSFAQGLTFPKEIFYAAGIAHPFFSIFHIEIQRPPFGFKILHGYMHQWFFEAVKQLFLLGTELFARRSLPAKSNVGGQNLCPPSR